MPRKPKKSETAEVVEVGFDSVSPEGGYAGPDSETEAARTALGLDAEEE